MRFSFCHVWSAETRTQTRPEPRRQTRDGGYLREADLAGGRRRAAGAWLGSPGLRRMGPRSDDPEGTFGGETGAALPDGSVSASR
jgi:hypothetical protein